MYKSLLLLCLAGVVCAQQDNLDSVIRVIFGINSTEDPLSTIQEPSTILQPSPPPQTESEDQPCTTGDVKDGRCERYYRCDTNFTIIQDGVGVMDIRFEEGPCKSYLDVCCSLPDARKDNSDQQIQEIKNPDDSCGWRKPNGVGFNPTNGIVGKSKFGEFPWMVAIFKSQPLNYEDPTSQQINMYVGGGSLIHPAVVLTTAHHVGEIKTLKVRAGEWNAEDTNEIYPHQDSGVDSIIVHEKFNTKRSNLFYDIALLFLSSPIDTTMPNVGLACLPPPRQRTQGGETCVASGWGKDRFGEEGRYQVILKKVSVTVVERSQCQTQLRKTILGRFFKLHSSFMCAGGEDGTDTCEGDGGSPLMCSIENEPNRYMQSGMVAWGIGCGKEGIPGVYVDVSYLRNWIDENIISKGFDPRVYTF